MMKEVLIELEKIIKKHGSLLGLILLGILAIILIAKLFSYEPSEESAAGAGIVTVFSQKRNSRSIIGDRSTLLYYPNTPTYRNKIKRENIVFFDNEAVAREYAFRRGY